MIRLPVFLWVLLSLSACSVLPKPPSTKRLLKDEYSPIVEYMGKYIPAQMKKHRITGLSVALVDDQKIVWSEGFGFSDKSTNREATNTTAYQAGSVSKLFTAMAVMKLRQSGKIDLDAPIKDAVPEFALNTRFDSIDKITLRNILSHHAGIPDTIIDGMWTNEPDSYKSVTTRLNRYYAAFQPNTVFAYSNAAYSVAGHAIENTSGMPYTRYVEESLLRPLEMDNSNIGFNISGKDAAKSYWDGQEVPVIGLRDLPAGGLVTTVNDLSNLVKLINGNGFYKSQLFSPQTMQEMLEVQTFDSAYEPDGFNAIGWFHFSRFLDDKHTVIGHMGQTMAHSAALVIAPEIKLGVVLLANSPSSGGLEQIADEILRLSHTVKTLKPLASIDAPKVYSKALIGTEASFEGDYISNFGYINISRDAEKYSVMVDGEKLQLTSNNAGGYSLTAKLLGLIPVKLPETGDQTFFAREHADKKMIFARRPTGQTTLIATSIKSQNRNPAWDARLGNYSLSNPIETDLDFFKINGVELAYVDGYYHLSVNGSMGDQKMPLSVVNDSEATLQGYIRGRGETIAFQPDGSLLHAGWVFVKNQ